MELPLYQVDAFASRVFAGNPAAVVPLDAWLADETLQAIAAENNQADTAYFVPLADGSYHLRWFTPAVEVDLCGHATVATAYVIAKCLGHGDGTLRFTSRSGELRVDCSDNRFALDFPVWEPGAPMPFDSRLKEALGALPSELYAGKYALALFENEAAVRCLEPDFRALAAIDQFGWIAAAPGHADGTDGVDFVSRFFAPRAGIDEDPVTGSAHCVLTPYFARRLGRTDLLARQVSRRGGELWCGLRGNRVEIAGEAVLYLRGTIQV